jgi:hypothetical protein
MQQKKASYQAVSNSIDNLRKITPDAAYQVSPLRHPHYHIVLNLRARTKPMFTNLTMKVINFDSCQELFNGICIVAFWGTHYSKLLSIKQK